MRHFQPLHRQVIWIHSSLWFTTSLNMASGAQFLVYSWSSISSLQLFPLGEWLVTWSHPKVKKSSEMLPCLPQINLSHKSGYRFCRIESWGCIELISWTLVPALLINVSLISVWMCGYPKPTSTFVATNCLPRRT